ncbi:MAG TPA: DUF6020 family protein, partial [Microlunatus sp.]|nr:DUF6020 family protein [Microlunatus sp.]
MISSSAASRRLLPSAAVLGALIAALTVYADAGPGPLLSSLHGSGISAVVVVAAFTACGLWTLRQCSISVWRWAIVIGVVFASAQSVGMSLRQFDALIRPLLARPNRAWTVVHWLGTAWMVTCSSAALIAAIDALANGRSRADSDDRGPGLLQRFLAAMCSVRPGSRWKCWLAIFGALVLSRLPYLVIYWPGIVAFDTFRSYSYARGIGPWESYEPVGASMLIAVADWFGTHLRWGDAGGVAIGSVSLIVASSGAFTFMLARMAAWGVPRRVWIAGLAWIVLLPLFGYYSVTLAKDAPFSIAMVVFMVCLGELSFGKGSEARRLWPWITLTIAGLFVFATRNNGVHVLALTLPVILLPLRHLWRRIVVITAVLAVAFGLYVGPVYAALKVRPGPAEETFSVPIQQLGRIAKYHSGQLSAADTDFMRKMFAGMPPHQLGKHYVPGLSDPIKLQARKSWKDHSTAQFLTGWARIATTYPKTAIAATLANTVGYWDPEGPSYDGFMRWSVNDVRTVHLNIPSGKPTTGIASWIESKSLIPTQSYARGLSDDGYRKIPILGLAMSPGPICWLWLVSAVLVARQRKTSALAIFVPAGALLLTLLAGPVSGGQRYTLTFFMAAPLAVAAVALAAKPCQCEG